MRTSIKQKRFSKRRSRRKTSFPLIAIIPKKLKPKYIAAKSFFATFKKKKEKLPVVTSKKDVRKSRAIIDYKNVILLRKLITAGGKILPRRINKLTAKQQRCTSKAIKSARILGLLPFININKIRSVSVSSKNPVVQNPRLGFAIGVPKGQTRAKLESGQRALREQSLSLQVKPTAPGIQNRRFCKGFSSGKPSRPKVARTVLSEAKSATQAPKAPVSKAPAIKAPATQAPKAPVSKAPASKTPATQAFVSKALATKAPATQAAVSKAKSATQAPVSKAPVSKAPVSKAKSATQAPVSKAPVSKAPVSKAKL